MKQSGGRIIKIASISLVALILSLQLFRAFYSPISTDTVINYSTYNGIEITAFAIRDESVLTTQKSGYISYNIADGEKVKKNGSVAGVYADRNDANIETEIENLEVTIADLEEINGYNNSEAVDIDKLDGNINEALTNFVSAANGGKISNGVEASVKLLKLINRRQIATGVIDGFNSQLESAKAELKKLKSGKNGATATIKSDSSGYFVSQIDGYESVINSDDVKKLTPKKLNNLKSEVVDYKGRVVGKIVSDYEWYLAATISLDESLKFKEGDALTLLTGFESIPELPVTVSRINKGKEGNEAVVVFSCNYVNGDLATMRQKEMTVVLETYNGLQVNSKAIRFVDGQKGVFVLSGSSINFVPVNVLYSTDSYCICEEQTTGLRIKLYDEIVVKGKNLYDGKVVE